MAEGQSRPLAGAYRGQSIAPVPTGYIEAYARIGQGIAETGKEIGQNISKVIETYKKSSEENEAVNTAWDTSKAGTLSFLEARYGQNSQQVAKFLEDDAKFKSGSLTQRKTMFATYRAEEDSAKNIAAADAARAIDVRRGLDAARGDADPRARGAYEGTMAEQTITFKGYTINNQADLEAQETEIKRQAIIAKQEGRDMGPILEAAARFQEAKQKFVAKNYRGNNVLVGEAQTLDDLDSKQRVAEEAKAKQDGTGAPAARPTSKKVPVFGTSPKEESEKASKVGDEWLRAMAKTPYYNLVIKNSPAFNAVREKIQALAKEGKLSGKEMSDAIDAGTANTAKVAELMREAGRLYKEAQAAAPQIEGRDGNKRAGYVKEEQMASILKQVDKDGVLAGYFDGLPSGASLNNFFQNIDASAKTIEDAPAVFRDAFERVSKDYALREEDVQIAQTGKPSDATKTPAVAKILLADSIKKATDTLQAGGTVEIPMTGADVDPIIRTVLFRAPLAKNPDGTINMKLVGGILEEVLAAKVTFADGKMILTPVESEPITYEQVDLASARNAEDAAEKSIRNSAIAELKRRGIPTTEENIQYITIGTVTDTAGREYQPEFSSSGVSLGKPLTTAMTPAEQIKYQREVLALNKEQADANANVFGRKVVDPNTGSTRYEPTAQSETLLQRAPLHTPYAAGESSTQVSKEIKEDIKLATQTLLVATVTVPDALRKLSKQREQPEDYFFNPDGSIHTERLAGDEQAKREYIRELFGIVKSMGQGLGALSPADYYFIFTQAGVPVTLEEIQQGKGDIVEKAVTYFTKDWAQKSPRFFQNALDSLVAKQKIALGDIGARTNGAINVTFRTLSTDPSGKLLPVEQVTEGILSKVSKLQVDDNNDLMFAMIRKPDGLVDNVSFKSREEVIKTGLQMLADRTGYDARHLYQIYFPEETKPSAK
jgi:hypothetical protein